MHELVTNAQRTTFTARSQQTLGKANPITQTTQVIKSPMTTPHTLLQQKYKKYMYLLGVAEVVLGSVVLLLGITSFVIHVPKWIYYDELIFYFDVVIVCWAVLIVVSGCLGIAIKNSRPSPGLINTYMSLAIIGSVFSAINFGLSILYAFIIQILPFLVGAGCFVVSLIFLITSAALSCNVKGNCCQFCCVEPDQQVVCTAQQVAYTGQPHYQPMQQMQVVQNKKPAGVDQSSEVVFNPKNARMLLSAQQKQMKMFLEVDEHKM